MGSSTPSIYEQLPTTTRRERDGRNAVERLAVAVVAREVAAMPASLVVQLALWPDEIAGWARAIRTSESLVYNMLAGRKPYARTRALLAERLAVSLAVLDHLIEARRARATTERGPAGWSDDATAATPATDATTAAEHPERSGPIDWRLPPYPRRRDGTNPVERRAVRVMEHDVASMPAATVVGLAIWPDSLSAWSRAERLKSSVVWATLAGSPSVPVRDALARRLGVSLGELDALVLHARAVPQARRPVAARIADSAPAEGKRGDAPRAAGDRSPRAAPRGDDAQLGLGF